MDTGDSSTTLTLTRCTLRRLASLLNLTMVTLLLSGCQCMEPDPIRVGGSSTLLPMSQAAAKEMKVRRPDIKVELESGGTSKGLQDFCQGRLDMAGASRPIRIGELTMCQGAGIDFVEVPVAFDGIAVVVHPDNDWVEALSVTQLSQIWRPAAEGKLISWADIDPSWPNKKLTLYAPEITSGTYDTFTRTIVGREGEARKDVAIHSDDSDVAKQVAGDTGALGFFGFAYYLAYRSELKLVPIIDDRPGRQNTKPKGAKKPGGDDIPAIAPSTRTIADGTYTPLARPLFLYINLASAERADVARFADLYLSESHKHARRVGYIPLTGRARELTVIRFHERQTGSAFSNETQGVNIEARLTEETRTSPANP